ncbi:dipeptidase [Bacillus infantis]|uniref:dipeptidase n=1 Tax=Bacillus infantis TaxID=324767 RepID=UPI003CEE91D9
MLNNVFDYLKKERDTHLQELTEFLSIPSISALPDHKEDVRKAAEWTARALEKAGAENVNIYDTSGHPVVYGDYIRDESRPTVLIYGHYDVQPADPLELWESAPFDPEIRDEKIFARGASDDKGQVFMHIKAFEALLKVTGNAPVNFKFCIEGEEEIGSPNLPKFAEEHRELLSADAAVISDTSMMEKGRPSICYGLRGLCGLQIDLKGANADLHSGLYGGAVQNPIHALAKIVSSFHDFDGKILVDGFYDQVETLTEQEKEAYDALGLEDDSFKSQAGVKKLFGESGYSTVERLWVRPTLEVNGIGGGFQGEGIKTVIPSRASAKITCRLVPNQDPDEIARLLEEHIKKHTPPGVELSVTLFDKGAPYVTPFDHPAIQTAGKAYEKVYGVPAAFTRGGGSIPIVSVFDQLLGLPVVLMGFGLPEENFHAPNEHFHLENFDKGMQTLCHYWADLAEERF